MCIIVFLIHKEKHILQPIKNFSHVAFANISLHPFYLDGSSKRKISKRMIAVIPLICGPKAATVTDCEAIALKMLS